VESRVTLKELIMGSSRRKTGEARPSEALTC